MKQYSQKISTDHLFYFPLLLKHTTTISVTMRITVLTKIVSGLQFYSNAF